MRTWWSIVLVAGICVGAQAREVVWTGAVSDDFSVADNWSGGVPESGDVAKFSGPATIKGAFDFGTKGLVLDVADGSASVVTCRVDFAGSGRLTKTGGGRILFGQAKTGSFTGGLRIEGGQLLCLRPPSATWWNTYVGDEANVVELVLKGDATSDPQISFRGWGGHLTNPVRVSGTSAADHLTFVASDKAALGGDLSAETDVRFVGYSGDRDYRIGGNVSMTGHTLFCDTRSATAVMCVGAGDYWIHKTFVGNLATVGKGTTRIWAKGTDPANELSVGCRTELARAWQGTNIVVSGASAVLSVGVQNNKDGEPYNYGSLSSNACVRLLGGAKLELVIARDNRIRALTVGNESLPEGRYTSANRPDLISGEGALCIGACKEWVGGSSGLLSDGANWSDGQPARGGETLIFRKKVDLGVETVDFGSGGFVFCCEAGCDVTNRVRYCGTGRLVKRGAGRLALATADTGTFSGGVRVEDGVLLLLAGANVAGWNGVRLGDGKGTVEIAVEGDGRPQVATGAYGARLKNPVRVTGSACSTNYYALSMSDRGGYSRVTADADFAIRTVYHSANLVDDLVAPGRTVLVNAGDRAQGTENGKVYFTTAHFQEPVDASIVKVLPANLQIDVGTTNAANALTVLDGKVTLAYLSSWAGTNVAVRGGTSRLVVTAAQNLSPAATVRLAEGAKVEIGANVRATVGRLFVDGAEIRHGAYTAATLPTAISGEGVLRVGDERGFAVALGVTPAAPPDAPELPLGPMQKGRRIVWRDEFDGTHLDLTKWRVQHLTDKTDVVYAIDARTIRVEGGKLQLMVWPSGDATHPWLMPENVVTHETMGYRYGYLEMRANIAFRHGAWPAFWLQSTPKLRTANWMSEIDVFEVFSSPRKLNAAFHKWGDNGGHVSLSPQPDSYAFADYANLNAEYHVYGMEWTPEVVRFYVDGVCYTEFPITEADDFGTDQVPGMAGFHDFHSVIFSDGIFTPGSGWQVPSWYLSETDEMPVSFKVDWIRLWQKPAGEELRRID